ncbi:hypothetical protein FHS72_000320 [Loktanella ponticola]|uniref:Guanylate cyclase domain-containing protein n=1 Tax=Yoonia ponticola TaxID=1524255 RepID=A0A7W9EYA5_9RHOB|nr:hypothetical protein [Yoonia ponticola]MBB5720716.1 hypothetical protein [Yoonia ponticola]
MSEIFEKRFVVFIDILGFGAMVSAASKDPDGKIAKRVDQALSIIHKMSLLEVDVVDTTGSINGFHSHIFSDCIVMSVKPESFAVSKLFIELARLTVDLMSIGVWIRGGMSHGLISKRRSTPWGPSVVEAYNVESQLAVNPRIALSKTAHDFVVTQMDRKQEESLIVRDEDGIWSLAPFVWALRSSYEQNEILTEEKGNSIKKHLEVAHRDTVDNPKVFKKIDWLSWQWDTHVKPRNGHPRFDCRTHFGKSRDLVDVYARARDS